MSTVVTQDPSTTVEEKKTERLVLHSYEGLACRDVSLAAPRDCTDDEIPVIDLSGIDGDNLQVRSEIAKKMLWAAEHAGFFYIQNHGVSEQLIDKALAKTKEFFKLPLEEKMKAETRPSISHYGFKPAFSRRVNPNSSPDSKEAVNWHYEPRFDPLHCDNLKSVPQQVLESLPQDPYVWEALSALGMYEDIIPYYQALLTLARQIMKVLAIALDLPESYFNELVKYPGGDFALNYYPGRGDEPILDPEEVGLGAHTDLQVLTLLYQSDDDRGLQVLNNQNEWVYAPPMQGTFVVNIGDFLMRLTNNRLKSTVHRVIQHGKNDRYSIPLFFGFDFGAKLAVLPTCISDENPARYEPARIGDLIRKRLAMAGYYKEGTEERRG